MHVLCMVWYPICEIPISGVLPLFAPPFALALYHLVHASEYSSAYSSDL